MIDLISKQATLDALCDNCDIVQAKCAHYPCKQYKAVETLPSVQPAVDSVEVVRCKDCRHRDPEDHKCDSGENERQGCPFKVADDYFCAYGER